ncbi:hypothetical protein R5R35_002956 [Gryllus longicercus]|uniref:Uncharacterized protein n=1 Tax=Gryllus longicercus TaxID=2509291 RepID=A0AAN9V5J2_9ORTH|nr:Uncharacterized protein GBIM_18002 [Gryllus bimaculatus]
MVIHVKCNSNAFKSESNVHYMPCKINFDGNATVSKYLQPCVKSGSTGLTVSFRGHPLNGKEINLPTNYKGIVLQERVKPLTEDADRNLHVVNTFKSITYWNWDKIPNHDDAFIAAMDWIDIAEALHSPVQDE